MVERSRPRLRFPDLFAPGPQPAVQIIPRGDLTPASDSSQWWMWGVAAALGFWVLSDLLD